MLFRLLFWLIDVFVANSNPPSSRRAPKIIQIYEIFPNFVENAD